MLHIKKLRPVEAKRASQCPMELGADLSLEVSSLAIVLSRQTASPKMLPFEDQH